MITVGLPFYNAGDCLRAAVKSVFAQTVDDWELILVDDGSADNSLEIARLFAEDPRVRVVSDGQNRGLATRLNQIADMAAGEYLARMDADDVMFPDRLERQMKCLAGHPDCDVLGGAMVVVDTQYRVRALRSAPVSIESAEEILRGRGPLHPTVVARTNWFRQNRYDETYKRSQDFELWTRVAGTVSMRNLQEPVLFYREYGAFSWRKYREHSRLTRKLLRERGPHLLGTAKTRSLLLKRRMKDAVYMMLACCGASGLALNLRNVLISAEQAEDWQNILNRQMQRIAQPGPG